MMWRRILLVDLVLAAALVGGILQIRHSWYDFIATHRVEAIQPEKEAAHTIPGAALISASAEDWTEISVKNPFSFDRNDVSIVAPKQAPPTQPKPVLFGILSVGTDKIAMLAPGQTGTRTSRPVKVGEAIDNWQVVEIQDKSVIVTAANGVRETIVMNDPTAQVARSMERTLSGSSSPQGPVTVNTPQAQTPSAPVPNTPPPAANGPAPQTGQPTGEILQTPFGPVPRTKP